MTKLIEKHIQPKLKVWLLQGKSITHNQAQIMWGTNRLSEYVRRLRAEGMNIVTEKKIENGSMFGVYRLMQKPKVDRIETREYLNQA